MKTSRFYTYIGLAVVILLVVGGLVVRRSQGRGKAVANAKRTEMLKKMTELQTKRESRARQLKAMDIAQLARELEADSVKGREPFNSSAYREMVSRGESGALALKPLLTSADRSSLLGMLAVRATNQKQYQALAPQFRIDVLINDLKQSKTFNTWGIPHMYWEDAAKAVIAEGPPVVPALVTLLRDQREALLRGSKEVMVQRKYKYRVCDYAWALLNEIKHKKVEIPIDSAERDKLIAEDLK
jgi:hypothetical protein